MPSPALRLSPYVVVRIDCRLCMRKGCYRLARLAVRYGPDMKLNRLLADLASDCPWRRTKPRKYDPRCGARFSDLDRAALPHLPTGCVGLGSGFGVASWANEYSPVVDQAPAGQQDGKDRGVPGGFSASPRQSE